MALFRNAATVLTTSVVAIPLGLAGSLILARWLPVGDRGAYGIAVNFAGVVFVLAGLGLPSAVIYEHRRGVCPAPRMMSTHLAANGAVGVLGALFCFVLPLAWRERLLPGVDPDVFALAAWTVPALVLGDFLRAVARSVDRFDLHNVFTLLQPAGLLVAFGAVLVGAGAGLHAALWANLAVQYGLALWLALTLAGVTGVERGLHPSELRGSLRYGLSAYVQNVMVFLQERLELFLVAYLLADSVQVGLYAVASSAAAPFRLLPNALSVAVFPELAERAPAAAAETTALLTRHSVVLTALLCAGAMPLVPWLVPLFFGEAYRDAVPALLWLLPGVCILSASRLLARWFQAVDRQRILVGSRAVAVLVNGGACLLLVPASGITGAAQASLAANAAEALLVVVAFCAHTGLSTRAAFALRQSDLEVYRRRAARLARR